MTYQINDHDTRRFLEQNTLAAGDLDEDDLETVRDHAEHHAGGLYVLWRPIDDEWSVKLHDSWGDSEHIVVHTYRPFGDDLEDDVILEFTSGHAALEAFLGAEAPSGE